MINKIFRYMGLCWTTGGCMYTANYKGCFFEVYKQKEKKWQALITLANEDQYDATDEYKTRHEAMMGCLVTELFINKADVYEISEILLIRHSAIQKHIRKWM